MRHNIEPINSNEYDIRVLWIGVRDHVSEDLGMVEGHPIDPPTNDPGWELVTIEPHIVKTKVGKEEDEYERYFTLWKRKKDKPKKKAKKKAGPKKTTSEASDGSTISEAVQGAAKRRGRPRRNGTEAPATPVPEPEEQKQGSSPNLA